MPRKSKGEQIDLLYMGNKSCESKKKKKKKTEKGTIKNNTTELNRNEIIIGLTPKAEVNVKKEVKKKKNNKKNNKKREKKINISKEKNCKGKKLKYKIIKFIILLFIICTAIILLLLSKLFNIKNITVEGNEIVSSEEIIYLSGLKTNENMFKYLNKIVKNKLKQNAYIEDAKVEKNIKGEVKLIVNERKITFMLENEGYYAYINNQGYILEVSDIRKEVPLISGYETPIEKVQAGNRLENDDLEKLGTIIKIMQVANDNGIAEKISHINISDSAEYILKMESEGKTIHFGNSSNINEKILWIVELLEKEKNCSGEMFIQDVKKVYFREAV